MAASGLQQPVLLYDADGNPIVFGQSNMAGSVSVTVASDQSAIPVSDGGGSLTVDATALPLPTGAATETTLSALNTNAADIETILTAIRDTAGIKKITDALPAGTNNIGDVDVVSSALPTGAATETTLAAINTKTPTQGQTTMANSSPVVIASDQSTLPTSNAASSQVDGHSVTLGLTSDADTANTVIGRLKQIITRLAGGLPSALVGGRLDSNIGAWLGSTVPTVGQKVAANSIPMVLASDQSTIPVSTAPSNATPGISQGYVATTALTKVAMRATVYTEQTSNAQRSVVSGSASDTSAGTGARTVKFVYYDSTGAGPFTETVTLNGTTAVNTVATDICFIEEMEVVTVGSGGSNVGIISLKAATGGGGATIGSIAVGDNVTYWAHHYVPTSKAAYITSLWVGHNGTVVGSGGLFVLQAQVIGVANAVDASIAGFTRLYGQSSTISRNYGTAIKVMGPARIVMYVTPESSSALIYRGAFDFYDQ